MAITIELPCEIERQLEREWPNLDRHVLEGFAVEAYRQSRLGSAEVGQLLGFESRWQTIQFLSERGVYPNYDVEDFQEDLRTLERLKNR